MAEKKTPETEAELTEVLRVRREKLAQLVEDGKDPFQITKFDVTHHSAEIKDDFDALEGKEVVVAGRMMSKRVMGKASFCNVQDLKGGIQCYVARDDLFHHDLGDRRDAISADIKAYLHKKAVDIARAGCNVILDWGFWSRKERTDVSAYYKNADIDFEWHYIDISDADWAKNMEARNAAVAAGETTDYAVDSGLLQKILTLFETPIPDEIDVWFTNRR